MDPSGIYINNPGNIEHDGELWQGEIFPGQNKRFKTFSSIAYGYRAMFINLVGYLNNGYNTIDKIISTWAPAKENDTQKYIQDVVSWTGISKDTVITKNDPDKIIKIVCAISRKENGLIPVIYQVEEGLKLAIIRYPFLKIAAIGTGAIFLIIIIIILLISRKHETD